jgi:predicted DNA-binding protein
MTQDVWIKSRVSPELKARFRALAARDGRTESGQLKWLLQSAVDAPEERGKRSTNHGLASVAAA